MFQNNLKTIELVPLKILLSIKSSRLLNIVSIVNIMQILRIYIIGCFILPICNKIKNESKDEKQTIWYTHEDNFLRIT